MGLGPPRLAALCGPQSLVIVSLAALDTSHLHIFRVTARWKHRRAPSVQGVGRSGPYFGVQGQTTMPSNRKKKKKKGGQPKTPSRGDNQLQKPPTSQGGANCLSARQGEDSYSAAAESCVEGYSGEDLIAR